MQIQKKRRTLSAWIGLMCVAVCILPVSAKSEHWYCVHAKDHERPRADASFSYIGQYDGYYIAPNEEDKVVYLTFDAGYENGNVARILDTLREKQVSAAFFVLSHLIDQNTELIVRMFEEGHLVCNHTAHHKDMSAVTEKSAFEAELASLETLCREKTGKDMARYYRPPEGKFSETNLRHAQELGYQTIFWSFAYADWDNKNQMSGEKALTKIMENVHPGEIMLLHPTSATNADILGEVIDQCRQMGYRFGTLNELTQKTRQGA